MNVKSLTALKWNHWYQTNN